MADTESASLERKVEQGPLRWWRVGLKLLARRIDHVEVVEHVREGGELSGRYMFMIVMACAIATLGLLLSSPAVIIGAMLISPLMGPIMLMGFSLSTLDLVALRRSVFSMACGVLGALAISFLIVKLSPLTEATPEILARTRPNFFDLLVAIFSGLAGGYAVINRKGETIVGVAIATALMPPLAVTGFGLAVGAPQIAGGAFFLFMTNLLAISLTVTLLSRLYSFGSHHGRRMTMWQTGLIILVFAGLSVPLVLALRDISYEARVANTVRDRLLTPFNGNGARLSDMSISAPRTGGIEVAATILTRKRSPDAEDALNRLLSNELDRPVRVSLDQVLVNEDREMEQAQFMQMAESSLAAPLRAEVNRLKGLAEQRRTEAELRNSLTFPLAGADIDPAALTARLFAARSDHFPLASFRAMEQTLREHYPEWTIELEPPVDELPLVIFEEGSDRLADKAVSTVEDCLWALERWGVKGVEVVGYASTSGELSRFDNGALAYRRAQAVTALVEAAGVKASPVGEYRAFNQKSEERSLGRLRFQAVLIRPVSE